jgi:hypothetical protein
MANREEAAMRLLTYRDESRSSHLICGRERPRSTDLVLVTTAGVLVVGFACALRPDGALASTIASLSQWIH